MALSITHSTVVAVPDDGTSPVGTDEWNAAHAITGTLDAGDVGVTPAGGIAATDVQAALEELDAEKQPLDADLTAIAALTTTAYGRGLLELADETALEATLDTLPNVTSVQGLTVTLADAGADAVLGWDDSASAYQNLSAADVRTAISAQQSDATLTALAAYNTNGLIAQTAADTFAGRTITGTANQITVNDGDGVAGNPTLSLHADVYRAGGTDVALADGGTGASLADPNIDRVMMWDDSAGTVKFGALTDLNTEASPTSGDFVLMYDAAGNLLKTDWANLPGGSAAAGGATTEIQYNNAGTLDGDPNFTWVAADGLTNAKHSAFGNVASMDTLVLTPGDPVNEQTIPAYPATLIINDNIVDGVSASGLISSIGYETSVAASSYTAGEFYSRVNSDSTNDIAFLVSLYGDTFNYGDGDIATMAALQFTTQHYGTGLVTDLSGIDITTWCDPAGSATNSYGINLKSFGGPQDVVNFYGLHIQDHSGVGSARSENIRSAGASSLNIFEGTVGVGASVPDRRLHVEEESAATNTVTQLLRLTSTSSGSPAAGIGAGIEYEVETAAANNEIGIIAEAYVKDATSTSEDFGWRIKTMTAGQAAATSLDISLPGTAYPQGHIFGLTLSNDAGDAANDIGIAAGEAVDETGVWNMVLSAAVVKRIDAAWVVGTAQGGMANNGTGVADNNWYEVLLIGREDTRVVDVAFSLTANRATLPTSYTHKRRIGWVRRGPTASTNSPFTQVDDHFTLTNKANDASITATATAAQITVLVPPNAIGRFRISSDSNTDNAVNQVTIFSEIVEADVTPSDTTGLASIGCHDIAGAQAGHIELRVSATSQIEHDSSHTANVIDVSTFGWIDNRRRMSAT
jgi:hypothetical protein